MTKIKSQVDRVDAISASFRDPSGFLFQDDGVLYRQVNSVYAKHYDKLMVSGLLKRLVSMGMLIPHEEVEMARNGAYKVLKPEMVQFISYPYEWSFSQLKDAALLTLEIQKASLDLGMVMKDASAYNVQFHKGKPILIDTLSFEIYERGYPWVAYRQFCEHFLSPLVLMSYKDIRLGQLLRVYLDGIPLDLTSKLLPPKVYFNTGILLHIKTHSMAQSLYADKITKTNGKLGKVSYSAMMGLADSLQSCIKKLRGNLGRTEWSDYYSGNSHASEDSEYITHKKQIVSDYLDIAKPKVVWDLGANVGVFSRIATSKGAKVVSFDVDPACVEANYLEVVKNRETNILPLVLDLTNPSPAIGWDNRERIAFGGRGRADTVLALALLHHLAISNNVPLGMVARFLGKLCNWLVVEFVPKNDPKVQKLLETRKDVFLDYTKGMFEKKFGEVFWIQEEKKVNGSDRIIYLMVRKDNK